MAKNDTSKSPGERIAALKASQVEFKAKAKAVGEQIQAELSALEIGQMVDVNGVPYEVRSKEDGLYLKPLYSARQAAVMAGKPLPPLVKRNRKKVDEKTA